MSGADLPSPPDDSTIPNSDTLYHRLSHRGADFLLIDAATGESRPSSGAFKPDPDGLSVYRREILHQHGLSAADVAVDRATNAVVGFDVAEARSLNLGVIDDPWPADSDGHPRDAAHALVKGLYELSKNQQLRCRRALTKLPSMRIAYPET